MIRLLMEQTILHLPHSCSVESPSHELLSESKMKSNKAHCDKLKPGHLEDRIIGCQIPFSFRKWNDVLRTTTTFQYFTFMITFWCEIKHWIRRKSDHTILYSDWCFICSSKDVSYSINIYNINPNSWNINEELHLKPQGWELREIKPTYSTNKYTVQATNIQI